MGQPHEDLQTLYAMRRIAEAAAEHGIEIPVPIAPSRV